MSTTPRKDQITTQIDTLLASSKTPKISPLDHRTVATNIINYIDNRILTAGAVTLNSWANRDTLHYVPFTSPVSTTNYIVIASPSTAVGSTGMSRTVTTIRSRGLAGFYITGATYNGFSVGGVTVLLEYIIIADNEQ